MVERTLPRASEKAESSSCPSFTRPVVHSESQVSVRCGKEELGFQSQTAALGPELCPFLCLHILSVKWEQYQCCLSIKQGNNCKTLSTELGTW